MSQTNNLTEEEVKFEIAFVREMYIDVDKHDVAVFDKHFAEDATLNFGDREQVKTALMMKKKYASFYDSLVDMEHVFTDENVTVVDTKTIVQSSAHFHFTNGFKTTVRMVTVVTKKLGSRKIQGIELFGDFAEVFAQVHMIQGEAGAATR